MGVLWWFCLNFVAREIRKSMSNDGQFREPVRLRKRVTSKGQWALYLDIYVDGRRKREALKLYLVDGRTKEAREHNRRALQLAETVRAQRLIDVQNGRFGFGGDKSGGSYFDLCDVIAEEKKQHTDRPHDYTTWRSCVALIRRYARAQDLRFKDITPAWVRGLRAFIDSAKVQRGGRFTERGLAEGTKAVYFTMFKMSLNRAVREGYLQSSPARGIQGFRQGDAERSYLTLDEVRALAAVECRSGALRRAFLFSCLTGLRCSDIMRLRWGDVQRQGAFVRLIFRQKKTGEQEYLDISSEAVPFMGERGGDGERVFGDFHYSDAMRRELQSWVSRAGINKRITFHCARHTFAVMMLDLGTDIYTVSKLLGHRRLSTTQIYARVLDKGKQAAVSRIPSIVAGGLKE